MAEQGTNTIDFSNATVGMTINLASNSAIGTAYATDTITNFTKVIGSNNGDTITGTAGQ